MGDKHLDNVERLVISEAVASNANNTITQTDYEEIKKHKNSVYEELCIPLEERNKMDSKLEGYRYISELNDFREGHFIRWIKLNTDSAYSLARGGFAVKVDIINEDIHVTCKLPIRFGFQHVVLKGSENIFFQKLSDSECIILSAIEYLNK